MSLKFVYRGPNMLKANYYGVQFCGEGIGIAVEKDYEIDFVFKNPSSFTTSKRFKTWDELKEYLLVEYF